MQQKSLLLSASTVPDVLESSLTCAVPLCPTGDLERALFRRHSAPPLTASKKHLKYHSHCLVSVTAANILFPFAPHIFNPKSYGTWSPNNPRTTMNDRNSATLSTRSDTNKLRFRQLADPHFAASRQPSAHIHKLERPSHEFEQNPGMPTPPRRHLLQSLMKSGPIKVMVPNAIAVQYPFTDRSQSGTPPNSLNPKFCVQFLASSIVL